MKKRSAVLLLTLLLTGIYQIKAQEKNTCGFEAYEKHLAQDILLQQQTQEINTKIDEWVQAHKNNKYKTNNTVVKVPVVFHVVWNSSKPVQNIPDSTLTNSLITLNEDFQKLNADTTLVPAAFKPLIGNANIEFCLAQRDPQDNATTGIIRKSTTHAPFYDYYVMPYGSVDDAPFTSKGGDDGWPCDQYLNVWVIDIACCVNGSAVSVNGPCANDGVRMDYASMGKGKRTLTHEVGHWWGLYHTFGSGTGCSDDDYVTDTPMQDNATSGCPAYPKYDACTGTGNGIMFSNFMDYSSCTRMFSIGQATRMQGLFSSDARRNNLKNSLGCTPPVATGINNADMESMVKIYPIPNNGTINIDTKFPEHQNVGITVYNTLGKIVYQKFRNNISESTNKIELSNQPHGIYFIHIRTESGFLGIRKISISR